MKNFSERYLSQLTLQLFWMLRIVQRRFPRDMTGTIQREDGLIHRNHALIGTRGNGIIDLVALVVADQTTDRAVHVHDLICRHQTTVDIRQQLLSHHGFQHRSQLDPDLALLDE